MKQWKSFFNGNILFEYRKIPLPGLNVGYSFNTKELWVTFFHHRIEIAFMFLYNWEV